MINRDARLAGRTLFPLASLMVVIILMLGACAPAAGPAALPTTAATQAAAQPTAAPAATEAPTAAPATAAPTVAPTSAPTAAPTAEATAEATAASSGTAAGNASETVRFAKDVMPIFEARCIKCHGGERTRGGLDMKTHASLMKGGEDGEVVKPGSAADSMLVELIVTGKMPRREDPLTADQIAIISKWVDQGAQNN